MVWTTKPPLGTQLDWTHPLNQGLVGFWVFNEGMGDKVNDLSGNANTGTLTNMAFPSTTTSGWNPGRLGPAIAFDGVNDYVDAGNAQTINFTSENFTMSFWVKIREPAATGQVPFGKGTPTEYTAWFFWVRLGDLKFYTSDGTAWNYIGWTIPAADTWYHISVVKTTTSQTMFVDGIQKATGSTFASIIASSRPVTIGSGWNTAAEQFFNGTVDEVRIYNRALSDSEIMELYINPYGMFLEEGCPELLCALTII